VKRLQTVFACLLVALALAAVGVSTTWEFRTSIFPMVVGIAGVVFALGHLVTLVAANGATGSAGEESLENAPADDALPLRSAVRFLAWLLAYVTAIWALGFLVGGVGVTAVYMLLERRESVVATGLMSMGIGALLWGLDAFAGLRFPAPALL
jgi:uncharacterized membrane protein YedE/YeeE